MAMSTSTAPTAAEVARPIVLSVSANGKDGSASDPLQPDDYIPLDGSKTGIFALGGAMVNLPRPCGGLTPPAPAARRKVVGPDR